MRIALLGGTGDIGEGLTLRWARDAGHELLVGSRDPERARDRAEEYTATLADRGVDADIKGFENAMAADRADVVVLAVPAYHLVDTVESVADRLDADTVLVTPAVGMTRDDDGFSYNRPGAGSVAAGGPLDDDDEEADVVGLGAVDVGGLEGGVVNQRLESLVLVAGRHDVEAERRPRQRRHVARVDDERPVAVGAVLLGRRLGVVQQLPPAVGDGGRDGRPVHTGCGAPTDKSAVVRTTVRAADPTGRPASRRWQPSPHTQPLTAVRPSLRACESHCSAARATSARD